jgi:hypothetical protein
VAIMVNRAVLAHRLFMGISRRHLARLIEELAVPWQAALEGRCHAARGESRKRAEEAGARHQLFFVDRLVVTLIHLRHDLPHSVLGLLFGVDRSTVTRAIGEIRTLLAERGCAVPDRPGLRLRALADVSPTLRPKGSSCVWTTPRSRSAGHRLAAVDVAHTSRARRCPRTLSASSWSRSLVRLDAATALLQQRTPDIEQAMALGREALRLCRETPISSVYQRSRDLHEQAGPWRDHPAVRDY